MTVIEERHEQVFPKLSPEQLELAAGFGAVEAHGEGDRLVEIGQTDTPCWVVLEGAIAIVQPQLDSEPLTITTHGPGELTGEIDLLAGRPALVEARVAAAGRFVRIDQAGFRRLMAEDADLAEVVMRAFVLRRVAMLESDSGGVVLVGAGHSADLMRLRRFLERNGHPHRVLDLDEDADAAGGLMGRFNIAEAELPVVFCGTDVLRNPSERHLAGCLGLSGRLDRHEVWDVAIVGAGPSGLAAAVYAASEGLSTLVLDSEAFGGQAGTSSKIENYLGFPTGISGRALAGRAFSQAVKFGAEVAVQRQAKRLHCGEQPYRVELEDGESVLARTLVVASGARYRRLDIESVERFDGAGVHYGATQLEAQLCSEREVVVVGGGNSAGQAAVFLSRHAAMVHMLVRDVGLKATMSDYLVRRIEASDRIRLWPRTEVTGGDGEAALERLTWQHRDSGESETRDVAALFVMIGALPNTAWLGDCGVRLDAGQFVCTGVGTHGELPDGWELERPPMLMETSRPGIFAVGDVRAGSVKRVASAVGEGSVVVSFLHQLLAD